MDLNPFSTNLESPPSSVGMESSESISKRFLNQVFGRATTLSPDASAAPVIAEPSAASQYSTVALGSQLRRASEVVPRDPAGSDPTLDHYAAASAAQSIPAPVRTAIERNGSGMDLPPAKLQEAIEALRRHATRSMQERTSNFSDSSSLAPSSLSSAGSTPHVLDDRLRAPAGPASDRSRPLELGSVRADFPALHQSIHGHPLVWLDNAATTHKPRQVIDAMSSFYAHDYSNIHRAAHTLAARATDHYEAARETTRQFIHASSTDEIVFVRGTTEGINLVANTAKGFLREGDEILLSEFEHHANIVPWQMIAREIRARIRVIPFDDSGEVLMEEYRRLLGPRTRLVALTHASNTLGTILPIEEMTNLAHHHGARVLIDGAQSIAHMPIDVTAIGCDFFVFSGHKVFAPTGIGVVYMHPDLHELLPPWQGGGNMIRTVRFDETTYADAPAKFEAGTPSIGDAVGLGAALNYLRQFDPVSVEAHEHALLDHATRELKSIRGVNIFGTATRKVGVVSFTLDGYTTEMVGRELDRVGIAVRTGHHCAQPSLRHFGLESTIRPSFAIYNTHDEVDRLVETILRLSRKR